MVFQNYALYPHMTVAENMLFALRMARCPRTESNERMWEAARILGLEEFLDRYPRHLSGGQRQRVAMGRAIVRNPKVFLFDEPLSNLDAKLRVQMRAEIKRLHQRLRATMIFVTHDQVEAMTMAELIIILRDGRVVPNFIRQGLSGRPLTVYGDGNQTRSFCYIDDLIEGVWRLLNSTETDPMNLGNPHEMTVLEFARVILKLTGGRSELVFQSLPVDDPKTRQPDIGRAVELLGWQPQIDLETGLERTIRYFRELLGAKP